MTTKKEQAKSWWGKKDSTGKTNQQNALTLVVEAFGTFALVLWIILPNTLDLFSAEGKTTALEFWKIWERIWSTFIMQAFWVAGFIYFLIITIGRYSCNLNPSVTACEMIVKNDSINMGALKITIQFAMGIAAAYFAYFLATIEGQWAEDIAKVPIVIDGVEYIVSPRLDAVIPSVTTYANTGDGSLSKTTTYMFDQTWFLSVQFILELLFTFILLSSIFLFKVDKKWRSIVISVTVLVLVTIGIRTNNIALNPARLLGPALVSSTMGGSIAMNYMWVFLLAQILAVLCFAVVNNYTTKHESIITNDHPKTSEGGNIVRKKE